VEVTFGSTASFDSSTQNHHQAQGGEGNTATVGAGATGATFANTGAGGGICADLGNVFLPEFGGTLGQTSVTVTNSTIAHNQATGGQGGDALGGGMANFSQANATVSGSTISDNLAIGGPHGNAFGGGFYNDATSSLTLKDDTVTGNHANAGDGGLGIGGGVYNLGTLNMIATFLERNHATTSHDDLYG
jgi:hypothetical protein